MAVEALQVIRQLVLSGVQASAEYVDLDITATTITLRDDGMQRCCPGVLRLTSEGSSGNQHSGCGSNVLRCKQAANYQHAATVSYPGHARCWSTLRDRLDQAILHGALHLLCNGGAATTY